MGDVTAIDQNFSEPLVKASDVARHIGASVSTVRKMMKQGLPFIPLTNVTQRCVRFRMSQVDLWLAQKEKRTA